MGPHKVWFGCQIGPYVPTCAIGQRSKIGCQRSRIVTLVASMEVRCHTFVVISTPVKVILSRLTVTGRWSYGRYCEATGVPEVQCAGSVHSGPSSPAGDLNDWFRPAARPIETPAAGQPLGSGHQVRFVPDMRFVVVGHGGSAYWRPRFHRLRSDVACDLEELAHFGQGNALCLPDSMLLMVNCAIT